MYKLSTAKAGKAMDLSSQRQQVARSLSTLEIGIAGLVNVLAHSAFTANLEDPDDSSPIRRSLST